MSNKRKAPLSWDLSDYLSANEEPPECVIQGVTEGEMMDIDLIEGWCKETMTTLCIIKEEYPNRFHKLKDDYLLDLDYLFELGKINKDEMELLRKENFNFGKEC